jgi:hypothetical protein
MNESRASSGRPSPSNRVVEMGPIHESQLIDRVARYGLLTLLLTSVHHAYGAWTYGTPWRYHVAGVSALAAVVILTGAGLQRTWRPRWARVLGRSLLVMITVTLPILGIGLFEGVYNHEAKNALYFGGASRRLVSSLFPAPRYELPNDALFEVSGLLQVVPAAITAAYLYQLLRRWLERTPSPQTGHSL